MNVLNTGTPSTAARATELTVAGATLFLPDADGMGDGALAVDFSQAWAGLSDGGDGVAMPTAAAAPEGEESAEESRSGDATAAAIAPALFALLLPQLNAAQPLDPAQADTATAQDPSDPVDLDPSTVLPASLSSASALAARLSVGTPPASGQGVAPAPAWAAEGTGVPSANAGFTLPAATSAPAAQSDSAMAQPEKATSASSGVAAGESVSGIAVAGAPPAPPADEPLKLPNGAPTQWRQPLLQALGDRIQLQLGRHSESAVIRLDPPQMGRIEIAVRHEGGALTVSLSATHNEVLRQLQGIGESLRHELSQRSQGEVTVQVADAPGARGGEPGGDGRQRGRQSAPQEDPPGQALAEAETRFDAAAFRLAAEQE